MTLYRRHLLLLLGLAAAAARAQAPAPAAHPLDPIAHWVGGEWVGEFDAPGGGTFKVIRDYHWSFDRRVLVGRSWAESKGERRQTRETHFYWNPEARRIEFIDHLDQAGGQGLGTVELREGQIFMNVRVVGNPRHPSWRGWLTEKGDEQEIRVEALRDTTWGPMGTYRCRRVRP